MSSMICNQGKPGNACNAPPGQTNATAEEGYPLISYAPSAAATGEGSPFETQRPAPPADLPDEAGDTTSTRIRFVSQASLEAVREKLKVGREIKKEDMQRVFSLERMPDEALVAPVLMAPGAESFEEIMRKHGPRGAASTIVAARERCEASSSSDPVAVKDWRSMAGETDAVLKPLLLMYLALSALAACALNVTRDATLPFLAVTLLHLAPESLLWSYLLLGPEPGLTDRRWLLRMLVRMLYAVGQLLIVAMPYGEGGLATPLVLGLYCTLSGISDAVCLFLGAFYYFYRLDVNVRRLGVGLFSHGVAAQLCAVGFVSPGVFEQNGTEDLHNWGWFLMVVASLFAFVVMVPIFRVRSLNIRAQQPSPLAAGLVMGGAVLSVLSLPLLAGVGYAPMLRRAPAFLPRGWLLTAYKVSSSVVGLILAIHVTTEYGSASRKLLALSPSAVVGLLWPTGSPSNAWLQPREDSRLSCCMGGTPPTDEHPDMQTRTETV